MIGSFSFCAHYVHYCIFSFIGQQKDTLMECTLVIYYNEIS